MIEHSFPRWLRILTCISVTMAAAGCDDIGSPGMHADSGSDIEDTDDATPSASIEFQATLSEKIPTVVRVNGTIEMEGFLEAAVSFGDDGSFAQVASVVLEDGGFETLLVGLKPDTAYDVRVECTGLDGTVESPPTQVITGPKPTTLPPLERSVGAAEDSPTGFFVTSFIPEPNYAVILDGDGEIVWWYPLSPGKAATTRLSPDHSRIWALDGSALLSVSLDGEQTDLYSTDTCHHDFTFVNDGTVACLASERRTVAGCGDHIEGDVIVEFDVKTGDRKAMSMWDIIEFDCDDVVDGNPFPMWGHANAIDYDPVEDAYIVSFSHWGALYAIDRQTATVRWSLGGADSDFVLVDHPDGTWFNDSHGFHLVGDRILVFDNGSDTLRSEVVGYHLDFDTFEASPWLEYGPGQPMYVYALGDVSMAGNGQILSTWSTAGQLMAHDQGGNPIWQFNTTLGHGLGYTTWVPSLRRESGGLPME